MCVCVCARARVCICCIYLCWYAFTRKYIFCFLPFPSFIYLFFFIYLSIYLTSFFFLLPFIYLLFLIYFCIYVDLSPGGHVFQGKSWRWNFLFSGFVCIVIKIENMSKIPYNVLTYSSQETHASVQVSYCLLVHNWLDLQQWCRFTSGYRLCRLICPCVIQKYRFTVRHRAYVLTLKSAVLLGWHEIVMRNNTWNHWQAFFIYDWESALSMRLWMCWLYSLQGSKTPT